MNSTIENKTIKNLNALTERDKMLSGKLYDSADEVLIQERKTAQSLLKIYNLSSAIEAKQKDEILRRLLSIIGEDVIIEPPFYCDYGYNIIIKDKVFINYNCVFLDCNQIKIGEKTLIGPAVQIYTAAHPVNPVVRSSGLEYALPVVVGNNVWIGGGTIICPGVTIGDNSVIGAGSVVIKDIPANSVAVGNPCKIIKNI